MTASMEEELRSLRARVAELERKEEEARAREQESARMHALYRALLEKAPIGLGVVSDDGEEFVLYNGAMLQVSGFAPDDLEGWKRTRASEYGKQTRAPMMAEVQRRGGMPPTQVRIPRPDGQFSDANVTLVPIQLEGKRYWHVTMQDVTELKRVEHALRESEIRFRQLAGTVRHVFYLTGPNFRDLVYVSPAYEKEWGLCPAALYADTMAWLNAIHPEDRQRVLEQIGRGSVDHQYTFEYRMIKPDGSVHWISDRAFELLDAEGKVYRLAGVAEDITERKRFEAQLREAQKMEAVGQLAGGVAHDFNNLLTAIVGNVSLLLRRMGENHPDREQLEGVELAAARATELTKKLLGFSRRAVLSLEPLDLRSTARETAALLRRTLDPRVHLVLDESEAPCVVLADAGEMSQVLLNLCLNSRDAMPEGGRLVIRTRTRLVSEAHAREVLDAVPGDAVCVTVEDNGHGMSAEVRGRAFEPFFTTKQPGAGTGLGLSTVFGIVKQHRGWVELKSEPGRGTCFDIYLPRYSSEQGAHAVASESAPAARAQETVLVVDDEDAVRRVAEAILTDRGYRVLCAEDGVEALRLYEHMHREIHLVILDLRMRNMSGRETLHAIWRVNPEARVLISSGHAGDHERVAESEPIAGSLPKPYGFDELARAVREALDRNPPRTLRSAQ
jgi:PAS domain S-box-containing protein